MARPEKEKALRKDRVITVRLREIQYELVANRAEQAGISISEYIRDMAVNGYVKINYSVVANLPELQKLTTELSAIGNNLNQIARYFNMGGLQSKAMREEINQCIVEIMRMRKAVMNMAGDFHGNA